jgi:hypothetical protein
MNSKKGGMINPDPLFHTIDYAERIYVKLTDFITRTAGRPRAGKLAIHTTEIGNRIAVDGTRRQR